MEPVFPAFENVATTDALSKNLIIVYVHSLGLLIVNPWGDEISFGVYLVSGEKQILPILFAPVVFWYSGKIVKLD